jgi:hypothetical protein
MLTLRRQYILKKKIYQPSLVENKKVETVS